MITSGQTEIINPIQQFTLQSRSLDHKNIFESFLKAADKLLAIVIAILTQPIGILSVCKLVCYVPVLIY